MAQRWLRDEQPLRSPAEIELLGERHKIADLTELDVLSMSEILSHSYRDLIPEPRNYETSTSRYPLPSPPYEGGGEKGSFSMPGRRLGKSRSPKVLTFCGRSGGFRPSGCPHLVTADRLCPVERAVRRLDQARRYL